MDRLKLCREALDAVDREIVQLFERRMEIAGEVAKVKIENHLPVLDAAREAQVLQSRAAMAADSRWGESIRVLFETVMALSRAEQERLLKEAEEEC